MRAIPRFLAPSILKSSQRGKFAPEPQIVHLTKLIDQQQQLQLTTIADNKELTARIQKLNTLLETSNSAQKRQKNDPKEDIHKNKTNNTWWHFWSSFLW